MILRSALIGSLPHAPALAAGHAGYHTLAGAAAIAAVGLLLVVSLFVSAATGTSQTGNIPRPTPVCTLAQ